MIKLTVDKINTKFESIPKKWTEYVVFFVTLNYFRKIYYLFGCFCRLLALLAPVLAIDSQIIFCFLSSTAWFYGYLRVFNKIECIKSMTLFSYFRPMTMVY